MHWQIALLIFVARSGGAEELTCTLCPGNTPPSNGALVVGYDDDLGTITCNVVAKLVLGFTSDDCADLVTAGLAFVCGCSGAAAGSCPGLCRDGSDILFPDLELIDGSTCTTFNRFAMATSKETECASYQQDFGTSCCFGGSNASVAQTCSGICANGNPPLYPDAAILELNVTCGEADSLLPLYISNNKECPEIQRAFGVPYCGCTEVAPTCSGICSNGQPPLHPNSTIIGNLTCGEYDAFLPIYGLNETDCAFTQQTLGIYCGCASSHDDDAYPICSGVCPNGHRPLFPNATISGDSTCGDYDSLLPLYVTNKTECAYLQQGYGLYCGCESSSDDYVAATCSGICANGQPPLYPNSTIFEYNVTCGEADYLLPLYAANETECTEIQHAFGVSYCGCTEVAPTCSGICSNGQAPLYPEADIFDGMTCGDYHDYIQIHADIDSCTSVQELLGTYCGCAAPVNNCTVCYAGGTVPEVSLAVSLILANGTETTCGDFQSSIRDLDTTECSFDRDKIADECGCPLQNCTLCPGGEQPEVGFDNIANFFTCAFASAFLVHGTQPDCVDLTDTGLPYLCGCPNAQLPSDAVGCTLCPNGSVSDPTLTLPSGFTCGSLDFSLSVANQTVCKAAHSSEEARLCGCLGVEAPVTMTPFATSAPADTVTSRPLTPGPEATQLPTAPVTISPTTPLIRVSFAPVTAGPTPFRTRSPVSFRPTGDKTPSPFFPATPRPTVAITVSPVTPFTPGPTFAKTRSPIVLDPTVAVTPFPRAPDSLAPSVVKSQNLCSLCFAGELVPDASYAVILTLVNGTETTCGDFQASIRDLDSAECTFDRDTIAEECGCPVQNCTLCPGGEQPGFLNFNDSANFPTCAFASAFLVHGTQPDCVNLTDTGLPYLCGCPNVEQPLDTVGCTLCTNGSVSDPTLTLPSGFTCGSLDFSLSVANQTVCNAAHSSEEAWLCGCNGVEAPVTTTSVVTSAPHRATVTSQNVSSAPAVTRAPVATLAATNNTETSTLPVVTVPGTTSAPAATRSAVGLKKAATTGLALSILLYGLAAYFKCSIGFCDLSTVSWAILSYF